MTAAQFDLSEWDFLPPLDEASPPDQPPVELVPVEWSELPPAPQINFADPEDRVMDPDAARRFRS